MRWFTDGVSTSAPEPVPQRIGDVQRDQAAEYLRDHLAAGRLTQPEFDERLSSALAAKTVDDLKPLFRDLPEPRPGTPLPAFQPPPWEASGRVEPAPAAASPPATRTPERAGKVLGIASAAAWPLVIMVCFITSWDYWWLIFIPIALSSIAGSLSAQPRPQRSDLEQ